MRSLVALVICAVAPLSARAVEDVLPPSIEHEPCEHYAKGQPFTIWARFKDDSRLWEPKVIFHSGSLTWKNVPFERSGENDDFKAVIQAKDLKESVDYFIEVFDENGNGPARFGSVEAPVHLIATANAGPCEQLSALSASYTSVLVPLRTAPPRTDALTATPPPPPSRCEGEDPPLYCSPLLWAGIGMVVLAGGGVASYYLAFRPAGQPEEPPPRVRVSVTGPDPTALSWGAR